MFKLRVTIATEVKLDETMIVNYYIYLLNQYAFINKINKK